MNELLARASRQMTLFTVAPKITATNNASARNAYGTAAQEIVCAALGLQPIPINGNYPVCFDAEKGGEFFEIKSVKRGCKVVLYQWRLEKEKPYHDRLWYAILVHRVRKAREDILWKLADGCEVLVLRAEKIQAVAKMCPLHQIKREYINSHLTRRDPGYSGYTRHGYRNGYYNVSVRALFGLSDTQKDLCFNLYGTELTTKIHT